MSYVELASLWEAEIAPSVGVFHCDVETWNNTQMCWMKSMGYEFNGSIIASIERMHKEVICIH